MARRGAYINAEIENLIWTIGIAERERQHQEELAELRRIQEEEARQQAASADVWRLYRNDWVAWVHDMIDWKDGEGPTDYQDEIMAALPIEKRVSVRGPHGLGKSAMNAWAVLWYSLTRDGEDWKIPTTASVWRQLQRYLWPEVRKWARRLRWDKLGRDPFDPRTELLMMSLKLKTGEAFAMASDMPEALEGAHADRLLAIFDESKAISDAVFDALEGALSGQGEALALAVSTPGEPVGRFYDIHRRATGTEDWYVRHVTMEEVIAAGRMSRSWAEQRAKLWGSESAIYKNRVLGEFAASDEDGVIPLAWVEAAIERWREIFEDDGSIQEDIDMDTYPVLTAIGADIGTGTVRAAKTVFALRHDFIIAALREYSRANTMETAGRLKGILDANPHAKAIVDVLGIGAGVVDRMREQGCKVYGFSAGQKTDRKDRSGELGYADKRSEAWWNLRERLDPSGGDDLALPPHDLLIGDLTAPKYRVMSGAKIKVQSKDELRLPQSKGGIGRSTDHGDAVIQAFYEPLQEVEIPMPFGIDREVEPWAS